VLDLLLPRTDAGALLQAAVVIFVGGALLALLWKRHEWRIFMIGAIVLSLALVGLRAVH
jgi:hypothetical protein